MRFILTILFSFIIFCSDAQIIRANAYYTPLSQPLFLDVYTGAAAAYSLRKLRTAYTGAAIRVRKDTTGQPEQDIGFDANGNLDTVALKSFINARSGFVVTWYSQTGLYTVTQSVQANQPRVVNSGVIDRDGNIPCVRFNDNTDVLTAGVATHIFTHSVSVARVNTQNTINYFLGGASAGLFYNGSFTGVNGLGGFDNANIRSISGEDLSRHLGWFSMRSSSLFAARNGGAETNTGSFASSLEVGLVGGRNITATNFIGNIQEIITWNSNQSANKTGIESNINTYYAIY
jgi:hypothetical protein